MVGGYDGVVKSITEGLEEHGTSWSDGNANEKKKKSIQPKS